MPKLETFAHLRRSSAVASLIWGALWLFVMARERFPLGGFLAVGYGLVGGASAAAIIFLAIPRYEGEMADSDKLREPGLPQGDNALKAVLHAHYARDLSMEAARRVHEISPRQARKLARASRSIDSVIRWVRGQGL